MTDLDERLRGIDRLDPPDLWAAARAKAEGGSSSLPPGPGRGRRIAIAAFALTVGLAAVAFAVDAFRADPVGTPAITPTILPSDAPTGSTEVPDVVGMTLEDATAAMARAGLPIGTIEWIPSSKVPQGSVASTDPWAGTRFDPPPGFEVAVILSSGPVDEGPLTLPGIEAYQVCRVVRMEGAFGDAGDELVVFEEENAPGRGCVGAEGFQHVAVLRDGTVTALSRRITDIATEDAWKVWPYATPDLDGDGLDEIVLATAHGGSAREIWIFEVGSGGIDAVAGNGAAPFTASIGAVAYEDGEPSARGMYCEGDGDLRTLVTWRVDPEDPLNLSETSWRLDGLSMRRVSQGGTRVSGEGDYPPLGEVELCGSPVAGASGA